MSDKANTSVVEQSAVTIGHKESPFSQLSLADLSNAELANPVVNDTITPLLAPVLKSSTPPAPVEAIVDSKAHLLNGESESIGEVISTKNTEETAAIDKNGN